MGNSQQYYSNFTTKDKEQRNKELGKVSLSQIEVSSFWERETEPLEKPKAQWYDKAMFFFGLTCLIATGVWILFHTIL